ncbi:tetraspanin-3-like [Hemicordylus capensis]|uniref:tetraspanin-3-like n=1 Tax=Hemicordylus capensis TaxID=884348 RepID=UPI0023038065|nr:tetraspanin-3-like [Hemicordylus capensis]
MERRPFHSNNLHDFLSCTAETQRKLFATVILCLLGFLFWLAAVALLFGGTFVILTFKNYRLFLQNNFFLVPGWLVIIAALLLFMTGVFAMCTPVNARHRRGTLMYLLVILFCLETSSVVMTQLYTAKVSSQLKGTMDYFFHRYNMTVPSYYAYEAVDTIHKQLRCCGIYSYTDWTTGPLPHHLQSGHVFVPESCCRETYLDCTGDVSHLEKLFKEGCLRKLEERLDFDMQFMTWTCVVTGCLELLAVFCNGVLMKEHSCHDFRILDSATFS